MIDDTDSSKETPQGHIVKRAASKSIKKSQIDIKQQATAAEDGLTVFAQKVEGQISGFSDDAREAIEGYVSHRADALVDAISNAPTLFYDRVNQGLRSLEVDQKSFRQNGEGIKSRLFANFGVTETVA